MHAENWYALTYNDSSCVWKKKQAGKWEGELERSEKEENNFYRKKKNEEALR